MAKEKQEPYEFLSNLVLALMDMDRIFSNSFFISEFAISPKTLGEIGYVHLSVCTGDPVYDEISSFDYSAGYVAEGVKNRTVFPL